MAKLKAIDAGAYPQEDLADEEPRFLRRQKPVEIKRRKFGRRSWKTYLRVTAWATLGLGGAALAYGLGHFLLASPEMSLLDPEQVELTGIRNVSRARGLDIFQADRGRSVLLIPLSERRRQLESIPWVEQATVRRALPHTIQVEVVERTPIAFLRDGSGMALVDVHGVILDRPVQGKFDFPVVTGITSDTPVGEREKRMRLFDVFVEQLDSTRAGAVQEVSEVDLSDGRDLRASLMGLQKTHSPVSGSSESWNDPDAPVLVHFGDGDFDAKYETLIEKMGQWRAAVGRIESVDLRFNGEAVVNSDTPAVAIVQKQFRPQKRAAGPAKHKR